MRAPRKKENQQRGGALTFRAVAFRRRLLIEATAVDEAVGSIGVGEFANDGGQLCRLLRVRWW
ncbi:MAG: hypothetical protein EB141_19110 [Verrucomicrobia bacterium]|nr:hypothetical protein [Verrucomicrobiota bacterium]NDB77722.1 hypothetical protein [Verrucomicrobiota bacterium]NDD39991.1 hypothetical protein [Verrucomicrobiota bacterium]NDE99806.1 hypothetical protein [Verrucomicrobiota bacterium]